MHFLVIIVEIIQHVFQTAQIGIRMRELQTPPPPMAAFHSQDAIKYIVRNGSICFGCFPINGNLRNFDELLDIKVVFHHVIGNRAFPSNGFAALDVTDNLFLNAPHGVVCLIRNVELGFDRLVALDFLCVNQFLVQPHLPFLCHFAFALAGKFHRQKFVPAVFQIDIDERTRVLQIIVVAPQLNACFFFRSCSICRHLFCQFLQNCLVVIAHDGLFLGPAMHKDIAVGTLIESHIRASYVITFRNYSSFYFIENISFSYTFLVACIIPQRNTLFNVCKIVQKIFLYTLPVATLSKYNQNMLIFQRIYDIIFIL